MLFGMKVRQHVFGRSTICVALAFLAGGVIRCPWQDGMFVQVVTSDIYQVGRANNSSRLGYARWRVNTFLSPF